MQKKRKSSDLSAMSAEDFLSQGLDSDSDDSSGSDESASNSSNEVAVAATGGPGSSSSQSHGVGDKRKSSTSSHKMSLEKLKKQDPEFYKFLQNEDKELLQFEDSDSDATDEDDSEDSDSGSVEEEEEDSDLEEDEEDEEEEKTKEKKTKESDEEEMDSDDDDQSSDEEGTFHELPKKLEVASDDSEASEMEEEEEDETPKEKKSAKKAQTLLTMKMVDQMSAALMESPNSSIINTCVTAFRSAVHQASGSDEGTTKFKVEGSAVFNGVIRMCIRDLFPALDHILHLAPQKNARKPVYPSSSKKWSSLKIPVKTYLSDCIQLLSKLAEPSVLNAILKHIHRTIMYYACFPRIVRILLKRLINIWSTGADTSRVLAFISIIKLLRLRQEKLLDGCIKSMYMAYVKNCKFTSPTTLPLINFMQRSLVEVFALNQVLTYQYAFVYIRQLAIHLRNAITVKKKETCQAVYNWQFIHSLELWVKVLSSLYPSEVTEPLIFPLTQTIIGTLKLVPAAKYYPLRFHCVKMLNQLSSSTNVFIPTLPFLTEVFELTNFNKKPVHISMKPLNFACILKLSKAQTQEKAFKDGVIDQLYELLLEHYNIHAHTVSFPELVLPSMIQLKQFVKKCKVANYTKQIKQIVEKVSDTSKVIIQRRKTSTLNITNSSQVDSWEQRSKGEGTPLSKFYATWRKLRDRELQHEIAGKERISTDDLPVIERNRTPKRATLDERKEFSEIFESDSEESDDETRFLLKNERPRKKQKKKNEDSTDSDEYSDFDSDDLEQLAQSGDEDTGDDEEYEKESDEETKPDKKSKKVDIESDDSEDLNQEDIVEDFTLSDSD